VTPGKDTSCAGADAETITSDAMMIALFFNIPIHVSIRAAQPPDREA